MKSRSSLAGLATACGLTVLGGAFEAAAQAPSPEISAERAAQVTYGADHNFVLRLDGEVNDNSANRLKKELFALAARDPNKEIILEINSGGGEVPAGWNIIDAVHAIPNKVTTVCQRAESMAAILLVTNVSGDRYAYPHCRLMLHEPSWEIKGTASAMAQRASDVVATRERFAEGMARASGMAPRVAMDFIVTGDTIMNAKQAYDFNLLDGIIPAPDKARRAMRPVNVANDFCRADRAQMRVCEEGQATAAMRGPVRQAPSPRTGAYAHIPE